MAQQLFSGVESNFKWTGEGANRWYDFDMKTAASEALRERNQLAKALKARGCKNVRKFSLGPQLRSKGGIGSTNPHIEFYANGYGVNWDEA